MEKFTCRKCGFCCSSLKSKNGGRFLEDREGNFYINPVPISKCRARYYIKNGIAKDVARESISKGQLISVQKPHLSQEWL
jgi:hypothetical protein